MRRGHPNRGELRFVSGTWIRCRIQLKSAAKQTKKRQQGVDGLIICRYNVNNHLGFATVLRFSPHFEKWSPGLQYRYATPPSWTPGDGRCGRQGTSLLHIAGEKTGTSAPWARKASGNGGFFLCACSRPGPRRRREFQSPGERAEGFLLQLCPKCFIYISFIR